MHKLKFAIGKAPSELPMGELIDMLRKERERVNGLVAVFRETKGAKPARVPKEKKARKVKDKKRVSLNDMAEIAKMAGIPIKELLGGKR